MAVRIEDKLFLLNGAGSGYRPTDFAGGRKVTIWPIPPEVVSYTVGAGEYLKWFVELPKQTPGTGGCIPQQKELN